MVDFCVVTYFAATSVTSVFYLQQLLEFNMLSLKILTYFSLCHYVKKTPLSMIESHIDRRLFTEIFFFLKIWNGYPMVGNFTEIFE